MKKLIRTIFARMGYDIVTRRDDVDPIAYNSLQETERFYSNAQEVEGYAKGEVTNIVANNMALLADKNMDLNHKTILDVSCGTGHFLKALEERFPSAQLSGTEFSAAAIKVASKLLPEVKIHSLNIEQAALSEVFDLVCCMQVLEHLRDHKSALRHLMRMVKPGGSLLLAVPDGRLDSFPGHIHFWGLASWQLLLQEVFPGHEIGTGKMQDGLTIYGLVVKKA